MNEVERERQLKGEADVILQLSRRATMGSTFVARRAGR